MSTLIISLGLFIVLVVGYFVQVRLKRSAINSESDMLIKYKVFIDLALAQGKTSRIERLKTNSLSIRTSSHKTSSVFSISEVNNRMIIVWTWSDNGLGRRGKEWSFPNTYDQKKMFDEVLEDVLSYQISTYQQHNMRMPASL